MSLSRLCTPHGCRCGCGSRAMLCKSRHLEQYRLRVVLADGKHSLGMSTVATYPLRGGALLAGHALLDKWEFLLAPQTQHIIYMEYCRL